MIPKVESVSKIPQAPQAPNTETAKILNRVDFPLLIWGEKDQQWMSSKDFGISPRTQGALIKYFDGVRDGYGVPVARERFAAFLRSAATEINHPQHSCLGCSVVLGSLCSNEQTDKTACEECIRLRQPCVNLCLDDRKTSPSGLFAYGCLPLPKFWRGYEDSQKLEYYVRSRKDPSSRGMSREKFFETYGPPSV